LVADLEERVKTADSLPAAIVRRKGARRYLQKVQRFRDKQSGMMNLAIHDLGDSNTKAMESLKRLPDEAWLRDKQIQALLALRDQAAACERSRDLAALLGSNRDVYPHVGTMIIMRRFGHIVSLNVLYAPSQLRPLVRSFERFAADKGMVYRGVDMNGAWRNSFTDQVAYGVILVREKDRTRQQRRQARGPIETGIVPASYLPKQYAFAEGFPRIKYRVYARGELRENGIRSVQL
jgi:hypothetical protein